MEEPDNPYTFLEGFKVYDSNEEEVGEVEQTIYDAPADVLKYLIVDNSTIPADQAEVHAGEGHVSVPYERQTIESAPELQELSGEFDAALRNHYGDDS